MDDRIIVFSDFILPQADKFLSNLILEVENKVDQKIDTQLEEEILQGLNNCNFLIRGYSYFEKRFLAQDILLKKDFLLEEKKNILLA